MLIEFKVSNFRSIREEQTLSLVASNADKDLPGCVINQELPGLSGINFLKGAALYGANASGKSNVLEALRFLARFIRNSATKLSPGDPTGTEPFKLDQESKTKPSEFEISFIVEGVRYLFFLAVTQTRVIEESLSAYPKGIAQHWYHRRFDEKEEAYVWKKSDASFKLTKDLKEKTRENALFLSIGPQFNHQKLIPIFNWFKNGLRFLKLGISNAIDEGYTAGLIQEPKYHNQILNILRNADFGVADATISEKTFEEISNDLPVSLREELEKLTKSDSERNLKFIKVSLSHQANSGSLVAMDFEDEESEGTKRFFALIGPWIDILENGYTVLVDEIETSLHPLLVIELLKLIFSKENNPRGAQLIFTTHSPILLDTSLMRRDQIWFTEKKPEGTTELYPLTDYKPRKGEALIKGYLSGRYGAIPYIPAGLASR